MQIPEHKLQEVLERTDLLTLIQRHVSLKKVGQNWTGLCPFHSEKSPSFNVNPSRNRFKCFGCDVSGDAITFVQKYFGKSFQDAVMDLARECGVDLQAGQDPTAQERAHLREVTALAATHFRQRLRDAQGKQARDYLLSRGVPEAQWDAFGLGWALPVWDDLAQVVTKAGMLEWAKQAGLCQQRQRGDGCYDMFRSRVIIPIRAPDGRAIAFGGRLLGADEGPKYLNSRESRLYNKSDTLYGLDVAKDEVRKRKSAVLVEGYFDCIGLHQAGVKHAVALCSTALTPGHLTALGRHEAKELVLLLDGDEAGRKAVERLCGPILAHGTAARVAVLPDGEDPDTFARKAGEDGVRRLLEAARPLTEHLFLTLLPGGGASSFEAKMQALDRLRPVCAALPVGLVRSAFFGAMANHFKLPAAELEAQLRGKQAPLKPVPKPSAAPPQQPAERPPDLLEASYAAVMLVDSRLRDAGRRVLHDLHHKGLRALVEVVSDGEQVEEALQGASDPVRKVLEQAKGSVPAAEADREAWFLKICRKVKLRKIEARLTEIAKLTAQLGNDVNEETRPLFDERKVLVEEKMKVLAGP
ncbi:MAG TPA: DNA primase [Myxococcaceae bacterium]|nr:DNA primase [Myxococcaceae bacterium]